MADQPEPSQGWSAPGWSTPGESVPGPPPSAPPGWGGPAYGAPKPGIIPLRPLGLGEVLDGAVSVVRRYPLPTLGLSAVVATVQTVFNTAFLLLLPDGLTSGAAGTEELSSGEVGGTLVGALGSFVVSALCGIVLAGIITAVMGKAVLGLPMTLSEAWQEVRPRVWRLIGVSLLTGLLVLGVVVVGVLLLLLTSLAGDAGLVLGIPLLIASLLAAAYLYIRLALAAPALVLEKARVVQSLRRSGVLVKGAFWRTLGILVLATVIAGVVSTVLSLPFQAIGFGLDGDLVSTSAVIVTSIGAGIAAAIVGPFSSGVPALLYIDRRIRAEGLDVSLAAAAQQRGT